MQFMFVYINWILMGSYPSEYMLKIWSPLEGWSSVSITETSPFSPSELRSLWSPLIPCLHLIMATFVYLCFILTVPDCGLPLSSPSAVATSPITTNCIIRLIMAFWVMYKLGVCGLQGPYWFGFCNSLWRTKSRYVLCSDEISYLSAAGV